MFTNNFQNRQNDLTTSVCVHEFSIYLQQIFKKEHQTNKFIGKYKHRNGSINNEIKIYAAIIQISFFFSAQRLKG